MFIYSFGIIDLNLTTNIIKSNINNYVLLQFKNNDLTFPFF
jgi:hypothetical protein